MYSTVLYGITNALRSRCLHFNDYDVHSRLEIETPRWIFEPHVGLDVLSCSCFVSISLHVRNKHVGIMRLCKGDKKGHGVPGESFSEAATVMQNDTHTHIHTHTHTHTHEHCKQCCLSAGYRSATSWWFTAHVTGHVFNPKCSIPASTWTCDKHPPIHMLP